MTLRVKALLITGLAVIAVFLILYMVLRVTMMNAFLNAEKEDIRKNTGYVLEVFEQTAMEFSDRFADWSSWDDAYQFVADGDQAFIDSNLNDETVQSMRLH